MPQMAPSMWMMLFLMFLTSYMVYMLLIYFHSMYKPLKIQEKKTMKKNSNWKW
nr:ATPase subunit 8 [Pilophorus typicus]